MGDSIKVTNIICQILHWYEAARLTPVICLSVEPGNLETWSVCQSRITWILNVSTSSNFLGFSVSLIILLLHHTQEPQSANITVWLLEIILNFLDLLWYNCLFSRWGFWTNNINILPRPVFYYINKILKKGNISAIWTF